MKPSTTKKLLLTVATTATILGPMIPKTVNFNITMESEQSAYTIITTQCRLNESFLDENGHQVCTYKCSEGDNRIIHRVMYGKGMVCRATINERVKKTEKI